MRGLFFQLVCLFIGFAAAWFDRDPSVWFASSIVIGALNRGEKK